MTKTHIDTIMIVAESIMTVSVNTSDWCYFYHSQLASQVALRHRYCR